MSLGKETQSIIQSIDFSTVDEEDTVKVSAKLLDMQKLRDEIVNGPNKAIENIDKLIAQMKST